MGYNCLNNGGNRPIFDNLQEREVDRMNDIADVQLRMVRYMMVIVFVFGGLVILHNLGVI